MLNAHEAGHTHPDLANASLQLLSEYLDDLNYYSDQEKAWILSGTTLEDVGCFGGDFVVCRHFYNPKTHSNKVLNVCRLLVDDCLSLNSNVEPTAADRAERLWYEATSSFPSNKMSSFDNLGRVLHLLQDMTSPAHVHDDAHGGVALPCEFRGSVDDFERWGWCKEGDNRIEDYVVAGHMTETMAYLVNGLSGGKPILPLDVSPRGFIHDLADRVYNFTTYSGNLTDNPQPNSELSRMFPNLRQDSSGDFWMIDDVGWFLGGCGGIVGEADDDWWVMDESCLLDGPSRVSGGFYIENSGGDSNNLKPAVWEKEGVYPTGPNNKTLLEIYGDNLYPLATVYGAGLLQVFKETVLKPRYFKDVREEVGESKPTDWFAPYVRYMHLQGVIQGYSDNTFRPHAKATRAEALQMAYRGAGETEEESAPDSGFADVSPGDWFYSLVADAKAKGFITGEACGAQRCFFPNDFVNRAEAAKLVSILLRVDVAHPEHIINSQNPIQFADVPLSWFYPYVYWLTNSRLENGFADFGLWPGTRLLRGYDDNLFHPERLITRAEMAKLLTGAMLYCRASTRTRECGPEAGISAGSQTLAKSSSGPAVVSLGALYEQVSDPTNSNGPAPFQLSGGDRQTVTGPLPIVGDTHDGDGDPLFYFWTADGGTFTTSDSVRFARVTWTPPTVTEDTEFRIHVVRGDHRGLVGSSTFRFLVPGTANNTPGSGTITSPNGTQAETVTVAATASDPDGLARVSVMFVSGGPELVLCGVGGPASCIGTSGTYSRTGINPAAFGATAGTVAMSLFVQDVSGDVRLVDSHAFTFSPPPAGPTFKLTIRKQGDGSGTVSGNGIVCGPGCMSTSVDLPQGSSVTLTGSAAAGSVFVGFAGERCYGTDPCTLTMSSNTTVYASFGLPDAFAIRFTTPSNGDTGVAMSAQVNVNFNRDIVAGPNFAGLSLRESGGTPVPFTPVVRSTDRRLVLIPSSTLAAGMSYIVGIPAGAVSDTQENPLATQYSFTFTTAVAGAPKLYISAYPPHVMEGSETKVSIWFETPASEERTITLTSAPEGELIHPSEVIFEAGEVLLELQVDSRVNPGSTSPVTVTLSAATPGVGQQSVQIVVANNTSVTGSSLKWQAAGVIDEDDHDGVFEAGESAEIRFDVANFGSSTISNVILDLSVLNTPKLRIGGGAPFTCNLGSIAPGRNANCTKSVLAEEDLPTADYFIQVQGTSSANGILDQARIHIVNNFQPDFVLNAGTFPSAELQPGSTVDLRYTARNNADGFSNRLPLFEVTLDIEGTPHQLYRTYGNARGYVWNEQSFRLPIIVPPVPGAHTIRARINPPAADRLVESDYTNNDAAVLTLRVAAPNQPPALNPIPGPLAAQVGRAFVLTASATDPDNDVVTYRLAAGAPADAMIGSTSGVLTWTPACGQGPASHTISVIAEDSTGATDTETVTINVGIEADLGVVQIASSEVAVPGQIVGLTIVATNNGPSCVTGSTLADEFPASLTNVSWICTASAGSSCAAGGSGSIGDSSVSLVAGGTATYSVTARVEDTAFGIVLNSATVTAPGGSLDPKGTNNSAAATFSLRGLDFGDAPDATQGAIWAFPTRLAEDEGPRHGIYPELRLGTTIDAEFDGRPSLDAGGDDNQGARDEDGVELPPQLVPCQTVPVQVTASEPGYLDAWIDFNTDGRWTDPGERIAASQSLIAGANQLSIVVPCGATSGGTAFARFRFSSTGGLLPSGVALDGEVEDYSVPIASVTYRLTVTKGGSGTGTVTASPSGISCGTTCFTDYASGTVVILAANPTTGSDFIGWTGAGCSGTGLCVVTMDAAKSVTATFAPVGPPGLDFYTITPCRVLDTRSSGPALASGVTRVIQVAGLCGIPAGARAVSLNITAVSPTSGGFITLFPGNASLPATSSINFRSGSTRGNNAILSLATDASGTLAARAFLAGDGQVDLIVDINGYFE